MELSVDYIVKLNDDIQLFLEQYTDDSVKRLAEELDVNLAAKNQLNLLTKRLIAYSASGLLSEIVNDEDFCLKTIKLDKYGGLKESMSLPTFKYCDVVNETWKESGLRIYLMKKVFAFTVYQENGKEQFLKKIVLWKMPEDVIEKGACVVWTRMNELIKEGKIVKYIDDNGRYFSFFPSATDNPYMHVRPHAKNRDDTNPLPVQDKLTGLVQYSKHSFWINRSYILKIISREE